jgi:hypothetical protein
MVKLSTSAWIQILLYFILFILFNLTIWIKYDQKSKLMFQWPSDSTIAENITRIFPTTFQVFNSIFKDHLMAQYIAEICYFIIGAMLCFFGTHIYVEISCILVGFLLGFGENWVCRNFTDYCISFNYYLKSIIIIPALCISWCFVYEEKTALFFISGFSGFLFSAYISITMLGNTNEEFIILSVFIVSLFILMSLFKPKFTCATMFSVFGSCLIVYSIEHFPEAFTESKVFLSVLLNVLYLLGIIIQMKYTARDFDSKKSEIADAPEKDDYGYTLVGVDDHA